ncbi:MAG: lipid-A-disaccharide synthase-related protein, partial [Waterburya sp.]
GSRIPEATKNWQQILLAVWSVSKIMATMELNFQAAIAPALDLTSFTIGAVTQGWQVRSREEKTVILMQKESILTLSQEHNQKFFRQADVAIAMAGTATEQFVGLGKPVITFPGEGPQFTYGFAEAQSRLLGCGISLVANPGLAGKAITKVIDDKELLKQIVINGKRRLGETGAAKRIAECLHKTLLSD